MNRPASWITSCLFLFAVLCGCAKGPSGPADSTPAASTASTPRTVPATGPAADVKPAGPAAAVRSWAFPKNEHIFALTFLPDGRHALIGNGAVLNLDADNVEKRLDFKLRQPVSQMVLMPDKRRVLASCWDHNSYLFDLDSGKQLKLYKHHSGNVNCLAVSSDGRRLLTGGQSDKSLILWDVETAMVQAKVAQFPLAVRAVAFLPGDRQALVGSDKVHVVDVEGRKTVRSFEGKWNGLGGCLCLATDGRHVLSASPAPNAALVYCNLETGQEIHRLGQSADTIWKVALSADGRRALSADNKHMLHLWDVASGKEVSTFAGHTGIVTALAFSADGRHALSASQDNSVRYWQLPE